MSHSYAMKRIVHRAEDSPLLGLIEQNVAGAGGRSDCLSPESLHKLLEYRDDGRGHRQLGHDLAPVAQAAH